jgi:hypothetical protein
LRAGSNGFFIVLQTTIATQDFRRDEIAAE